MDESGSLAGITREYISEFERITGIDFQQADIADWTRALESIRERSSDIVMVAHTDDRAEYMGFTKPHYIGKTSLVTLEETSLDIETEGLRPLTIRNYEIEDWLDKNRPNRVHIGGQHAPRPRGAPAGRRRCLCHHLADGLGHSRDGGH